MLGVDPRATHRPAELSGGEQQRVAIARAAANHPKVILADEPTGNLDPATSDLVFAALRQLIARGGAAGLIATHNHDLARRADRIVTIRDGLVGDLITLYGRPQPPERHDLPAAREMKRIGCGPARLSARAAHRAVQRHKTGRCDHLLQSP